MCKEGEGGRLIESGEWIQNRNGVLHVLCVRHWACARKERVDISGEWIYECLYVHVCVHVRMCVCDVMVMNVYMTSR